MEYRSSEMFLYVQFHNESHLGQVIENGHPIGNDLLHETTLTTNFDAICRL